MTFLHGLKFLFQAPSQERDEFGTEFACAWAGGVKEQRHMVKPRPGWREVLWQTRRFSSLEIGQEVFQFQILCKAFLLVPWHDFLFSSLTALTRSPRSAARFKRALGDVDRRLRQSHLAVSSHGPGDGAENGR